MLCRGVEADKSLFSTFADAIPKYEQQGLTWTYALLGAGIPAERLRVHHPPAASRRFLDVLGGHDVATVEVPPHPSGHGYCNKVQQLTHGEWSRDEQVVLCDADLLWLDPHELPSAAFAGKLVDRPNPPRLLWEQLLAEAGLAAIDQMSFVPVDVPFAIDETTPQLNLNGGLYILDGSLAPDLGAAWDRRIGWLGDRAHLLVGYEVHRDQVAMALALWDLSVRVAHLDRGWNFPMHLPVEHLVSPQVRVRAVHHHGLVGADGRLLRVGIDWVDDASRRINAAIATCA